jgi:hypothetical protein
MKRGLLKNEVEKVQLVAKNEVLTLCFAGQACETI